MAEKRANISETSEHNTDHKNERTPDNKTKTKKAKTGASRPEHNADHKNERTPDNITKIKQKPDLRLRKILMHYQQYHHSLQEKKHLGAKINQKTPILNRNMNLKETQVCQEIIKDQNQIIKDHFLLEKRYSKKHQKQKQKQKQTQSQCQTQNMTLT